MTELKINKPMLITEEEEQQFINATTCYICGDSFSESDKGDKVKDHCHYTGKYRGCAHNECNIKFNYDNY